MRALVILCTICFVIQACQQGDEKPMRLSSWVSSPSETAVYREVLDGFRQKYPEQEFEYEPIPGNYPEKIQLMLGTRTAPDLFYLKGFTAPAYMDYDVLEPLDPFMSETEDFDVDDFFPFSIEAFRQNGQQYGIPKDFNPYVMFYNKEMFREAGIDSLPTDWLSFVQACERLTIDKDEDGKTDQYGFIVEPSVEMVMPFVYQNGGNFQNPDGSLGIADEPFIEALEFYHGLYTSGVATMAQDQGAQWNGDAFGREKCAMAISGGWLIPFLADQFPELDYGIFPLPRGKEQSTVAFTVAYSIPKASEHKKDAWQLLDYLVGEEGMSQWTSSGVAMPTRRSVAEKNGFYEHPVFKVFMESAEFARPFQVEYSERGYEELVVAFQAVFFADKAPRDALTDIKGQIEKYKLVR